MPPAFEFRGNDRRSQNYPPRGPRHDFTFRYPRPMTAERPLLRSKRETTPELLTSGNNDDKPSQKFAPLENLSDSDETDMDVSDDDNENDDEESRPRKKRALESNNTPAPPPPAPKWSNPDPYTSLPPPDESQSKRKDVVKLIRKARIAANPPQPTKTDAVTDNEDFISLGGLVDEEEKAMQPPEDAPTGPRRHLEGGDPALGNRKRTHDDEIKGISKKTGKPISKFHRDASIIDEWKVRPSQPGTPWMDGMVPTLHLGTRLHNEILSFYHWVKPVEYEQIVRADLVQRLQSTFASRYYGVQVRPFGSFASGLYLPCADIDLVLLSSNFMRTGIRTFGERKGQIYAFSAFLGKTDIPVPGSVETIAHARVPIVKFVDKMTGLRVDLSFDNDSGLVANKTFQDWRVEYPAMPVIVSVVKQFLLLRGLNEVPTGGLGGFSITCLVTSLLQHLPYGHSNPNLGSALMDFFEFYGNRFDYENVGIRMNPPGYFNKRVYNVYKENNKGRLSIEDPNNPDNDISGGTREISLIFKSFSKAQRALSERAVTAGLTGNTQSSSILEAIIAANYDEYAEQRQQLLHVFKTHPRFAQYNKSPTPPPPQMPPPPADPVPPPPPANLPPRPEPKEKMTKAQRKEQASRERAARLRKLRPDIPFIPEAISNEQALSLGDYYTQSGMDKDLMNREKEQMQIQASQN